MGERAARTWPELGAAVLLAAAAPLLIKIPVTHDSAWAMWVGRQLWHGARFGLDMVEVNPPLWFWLCAPLAALAEQSHIPGRQVLIGFFFAAEACSLALLAVLIRERPPLQRAVLLAAAMFAEILVPLRDFTQREHFALIAAVPYAALVARRADGLGVSRGVAISAGLLAALGFALKPHFLLAPLLLELWLQRTRRKPLLRPETAVLGLVLLSYLAATAIFAPSYVTDVLPMARLAYDAFTAGFDAAALWLYVPMILLAAVAFLGSSPQSSALAKAMFIAAAAFFLAYLLQGKGWRYHGIPAAGLLLVGVAAVEPILQRSRRIAAIAACAAMFVLALRFPAAGFARNPVQQQALPLIGSVRAGEPALALSASTMPLWPAIEERHLVWPSRYFSYWMLPAIAEARPNKRVQLGALADRIRRETAHDIACSPPRVLLIDTHAESPLMSEPFDALRFWRSEPALANVLAHYRPVGRSGPFLAFGQASRPPRPPGCRRIY